MPVSESGNKLTEIMAHNLKEQQSAGHHPVIPAVDHTPQFSAARCHHASSAPARGSGKLITSVGLEDVLSNTIGITREATLWARERIVSSVYEVNAKVAARGTEEGKTAS
ncbi:hypothetical protein V502_00252 [Pseudogymnoascus sp. VKM F-4520 (FW-2644)]|nr:hypothetical protein V502_00252 [Pseudogymnoascus sp. VKM F-4520 (FW-2644)]